MALGEALAGFSVVVLGLLVNVVAAALLALTIAFYIVIYTMWLATPGRRRGRRAAADDRLGGGDRQPGARAGDPVPHHLLLDAAALLGAVALYRTGDYARAGVPMLPVVAGKAETRRQILHCSFLLAPVGAAPWLLGYESAVYGFIAASAVMIALALRIRRELGSERNAASNRWDNLENTY